jgi:peptide/nickel transport system substrate-binding protein
MLSRRQALVLLGTTVLVACSSSNSGETGDVTTTTAGTEPTGDATTTTGPVGTDEDGTDEDGGTDAGATTTAPEAAVGTLRLAVSAAPPGLDPHLTNGNAHMVFLRPVYDTLLRMDAAGELLPGLATAWEWEDDTTLRLDLRTDVTFSDGTPFDATAVSANITRMRDDERSVVELYDDVADIDASDPAVARITFTAPSPYVLDGMARRFGMMVSPAAFEGDLNTEPVGSGPWVYSSGDSNPGVSWVYTARSDAWDLASQGVERIEISSVTDPFARQSALTSGQVDVAVIEAVAAADAESANLTLARSPGQYAAVIVQATDPAVSAALADRNVRRALAASIDREAIVESVLFGLGEAASAPVASDAWFAQGEQLASIDYDPDAARAAIEAFGDVDVRVPSIAPLQTLTTAVGGFFEAAGARLEQITVDPTAPRLESGTTALLATFPLDTPAEIASAFFVPGSPLNPYGTVNERLDGLVAQARSTFDRDELAAVYRDIVEVLTDEALLITIATVDSIAAHAPSVTGVSFVFGDNAPNPLGVRVDG